MGNLGRAVRRREDNVVAIVPRVVSQVRVRHADENGEISQVRCNLRCVNRDRLAESKVALIEDVRRGCRCRRGREGRRCRG